MSQNITWQIDPITGDYVMDTSGKPVQDNSLLTPSYFRLKTQRTKWMYAPDDRYGADFYLVQKNHSGSDVNILETIAQRALRPCVEDGRASSIAVSTIGQSLYASELSIIITDVIGNSIALPLSSIGI